MKRLLANTLMLAGGLTLSGHSLALGLGELELDSALNQPLKAEIALVEVEDLSQWEIKPKLASPRDFENAGVDRVFFLTKIDFKVEGDKIILSTREPVTEPFLNFLVELNWPAGRVLREYTVLLDPPVFADDGAVAPLSVTTPATVETVYVEQPGTADQVETQIVTTGSSADRQDWTQEPTEPGTYKVKPNDTLWNIALNTRPDSNVSPQRMMVAIQQANPDAFIGGNINRLKTHKVLRIPGADELSGVSEQQALAEVSRQNKDINASGAQLSATGRSTAAEPETAQQGDGEVRLLSPSEQQEDVAGSSGQVDSDMASGSQQQLENDLAMTLEELDRSRRENEELRERLQALEEQIGNLERLITLKDDQLANMQLSDEESEEPLSQPEDPYAESDMNDSPEAMPEDSDNVDFNYSQPEDSGSNQEPYEAPAEPAVETEPTPSAEELAAAEERRRQLAERIARESQQAQPSMMDTLMQPILLGGSALVLALLGLVGYRVVRKRKESQEQAEEAVEVPAAEFDAPTDAGKLDDFDFDAEADLEKETLDLGADLDAPESNVAAAEEVNDDFTPVAQTEDVISESDIYIAYGKFDQAVDLLTGAIEDEPSRTDLRLKLLEVLVEMDDGQAFAEAEGALNMLGDHQANEQAQQMRSRLSAPQAPATVGGDEQLGMSLDSDIPELDESLSEEFDSGLDFSDALDLSDDKGGDNVEDIFAASADASDSSSLDFESALELGDDSVGDDGGLEDVPTLDLDADLDESLDFDLGDSAAESSMDDGLELPAEEQPESDSNGLDFDLSDFSTGDDAGADEVSAADALEDVLDSDNGDNALEFDLSSLQEPEEPKAEEPEVAAADADNVLDFDLGDDDSVAEISEEESSALQELEAELEQSSFVPDEVEPRTTADGKEEVTNADDFMSELESLSEASADQQDDDPGDFDLSADMADLDSELEDFAAPEEEPEAPAPAPVAEEPAPMASEAPQTGGRATDDIDLDELAAADDEFDFLAGTDECATKLDLARAYIDMEDADGAKELLQEVLQEGSDQQKQEARSMMDSMS
ncbi:motility protein FimV [Bacterioplanes sanyensis]|uniref:FimV/HubP family polar landmark protein n=1 Tax=Bacterioplanes sanyensis TaxID=1249553 RepID=UPI00167BEE3D|nr:FimV/HubP family polar landmark protein [Bacterioplanes sanyensis]GGY42441.1 motility protein FimV [Bacterioplanes sanyensis]